MTNSMNYFFRPKHCLLVISICAFFFNHANAQDLPKPLEKKTAIIFGLQYAINAPYHHPFSPLSYNIEIGLRRSNHSVFFEIGGDPWGEIQDKKLYSMYADCNLNYLFEKKINNYFSAEFGACTGISLYRQELVSGDEEYNAGISKKSKEFYFGGPKLCLNAGRDHITFVIEYTQLFGFEEFGYKSPFRTRSKIDIGFRTFF